MKYTRKNEISIFAQNSTNIWESYTMYVLDTNAFYYAAGISEFTYDVEKLRNLIRVNDTFISSTSLFEFFSKFRDDISTIRKGGRYLQKNNIKLYSNVFNPLPNHFTYDLANISKKRFQGILVEVIENKIDVESRFTTLLFDVCMLSGYYFSAFSDGNDPCEYCHAALNNVSRLFSSVVLDVFKEIYTEGYKTDDCENYVRNCFYNLLSFTLEKGIPFIEKAKDVKSDVEYENPDAWFTTEDYSQMALELASKIQKKSSTGFLQRLAVVYWKSNNDPQLEKHMAKIKAIFDAKIKFPAFQDYCYDTLTNILTNGAALRKNDLLDAIILCNVQDQHILITYDNGVIQRMEKRKDLYPRYQESLNTINSLKQ